MWPSFLRHFMLPLGQREMRSPRGLCLAEHVRAGTQIICGLTKALQEPLWFAPLCSPTLSIACLLTETKLSQALGQLCNDLPSHIFALSWVHSVLSSTKLAATTLLNAGKDPTEA